MFYFVYMAVESINSLHNVLMEVVLSQCIEMYEYVLTLHKQHDTFRLIQK
jgi:hypothetical protein